MLDPATTIRRAVPDDAEAIRLVQAETWLATYPNDTYGITRQDVRRYMEGARGEQIAVRREQIRARLAADRPDECDFVAEIGGEIVGFCSAMTDREELPRIAALYVLPGYQGQGIGRALINAGIDWLGSAHDIYLNVAIYNERAIGFYRKMGFETTARQVGDANTDIGNGKLIPEMSLVRVGQN